MTTINGLGWILATSLAACSISPSAGVHHGSGSGSGSDSGAAGTFMLDPEGFIVDGSRWWSPSSGPELLGRITADADAKLIATVGDVEVGSPAAIDGNTWSLQLPAGTIGASDTTIALVLSAPGKDDVSQQQLFDLDTGNVAITFGGSMFDERNDSIDFSSGAPVHTHGGTPIALGTGCPDVYKYAYLTSNPPALGREASPNPLGVQVTGATPVGIDPNAVAYRVRDASNDVLLDWTPLAVDDNGTGAIALHRDGDGGIAGLGTAVQMLDIDVRYGDVLAQQATATTCITYHPLAAPLDFAPIAAADTTNIAPPLQQMSVTNGQPVQDMLEPAAGAAYVGVAMQRFTQYTADPVVLDMTFAPDASWTKTLSTRFVATATGSLTCGTSVEPSGDPRCSTTSHVTGTDVASTGTFASPQWSVLLFDYTTGLFSNDCTIESLHATCTIPGRVGAPHAYSLVLSLANAAELAPAASSAWQVVNGAEFFGVYAAGAASHCTSRTSTIVNGTTEYSCAYATYARIEGLGAATLALDMTSAIATSVGSAVALAPITYAPATNTATVTWNGGVATLPGQ